MDAPSPRPAHSLKHAPVFFNEAGLNQLLNERSQLRLPIQMDDTVNIQFTSGTEQLLPPTNTLAIATFGIP
ncbi:hypothetical protein J2W51_001628 [Tardiphaga robiniae]|nr:hypothetical protein [Tardiphaga robiniae]